MYGPGRPSRTVPSSVSTRSHWASSLGYTVTNFPLEPRCAYFVLARNRVSGPGRNLKGMRRGTQ